MPGAGPGLGPGPGHTVGIAPCIITILLSGLNSNIARSATAPIVRDRDPAQGGERAPG